jgi:ribokinase
MLGCIGDDAFGAQLKATLQKEQVDTQWVFTAVGQPTGVASITLCAAENAIIVVPGANHALTPRHLDEAAAAFAGADIVLAQLEVPLSTVTAAAKLAQRHGKPFFLNPAPAIRLPQELLDRVTLLTPNEYELGLALDAPETAWTELLTRLPGRVVMTRGRDGASYSEPTGGITHQPGFTVSAVDTTGAGDTFNGALATFWHLGIAEALRRACAAGALSVTKPGAQGGMPTLAELESFLEQQP